jgi:hypothetical protein
VLFAAEPALEEEPDVPEPDALELVLAVLSEAVECDGTTVVFV